MMTEGTPSVTGALILLVMIAGGLTALMWEVFAFVRKRTVLSPARFAWRVVSWVLVVAVFFGMFAGAYLIRFPTPRAAAQYWSAFLLFAFVVVAFLFVLAFRDWRWLMSEQIRRKADLYHQLGEELRRLAGGKKSDGGDERDPQGR